MVTLNFLPSDVTFSEADLGLVKLVVMTNVFLNHLQHEIKRLIYIR